MGVSCRIYVPIVCFDTDATYLIATTATPYSFIWKGAKKWLNRQHVPSVTKG